MVVPDDCDAITCGTETLRAQLPLLATDVLGAPMTYLDTATATPVLSAAIDASVEYWRTVGAPPNVVDHERGGRATATVKRARQQIARFIGGHPSEVIFTRNASDAFRLVADAYQFRAGAEVIVAEGEPYSSLLAWLGRRNPTAIVLRQDATGAYDDEHLVSIVGKNTRLIVCSLVNHVTGAIQPVQRIVELARAQRALVLVDATHALGRIPVDVSALGCDILVGCSSNVYGPAGAGILWVRRDLLDDMIFRLGSGSVHRVDAGGKWLVPADLPERAESGTTNGAAIVALAAALDVLDRIGMDRVASHDREIGARLVELVAKIPGAEVLGRPAGRDGTAIVSFTLMAGTRLVTCNQLQTALSDAHGVLCAAGSLDGAPLLGRFGCADAVRVSGGIHTNQTDLDRLERAVAALG